MSSETWDPRAPQAGTQAPDLQLLDEAGKRARLSQLARGGPVLLLFFRGADDETGRALLRDYRSVTLGLKLARVRICGIAHEEPSALSFLRMEMGMGFSLYADPSGEQIAQMGMEGCAGLFIVDRSLKVRHRALADRASSEAIVQFIKRGGLRGEKPGFGERIAHLFKGIQAAVKRRHPAT
jgi:peroxiredoxin